MFKYTSSQIIKLLVSAKENFWLKEREKNALALFNAAAIKVPAYKDFLRKNKISSDKIKTFQDFQFVPPIDKKNYLHNYPLEKLVWDGTLKKPLVWTSTSGSTGEPIYFCRGQSLDWQYSVLSELYLNNSSYGDKGPTLVVVCLGMGVWIAGIFSYQAFKMAIDRNNLEVSIITPGINKIEIFKILRKLAPNFRQTILVGYPPFLKDIIDEASKEGIDLKRLNIRFLSGAEAFTEKFRDYLVKKSGIGNLYFDTLNVYGSADVGTMAYETPTSILIRRLIVKNRNIFRDIFSQAEKTPTLAQYLPLFICFEEARGEIFITGDNAIPLIRYNIGDRGGIFSYGELTMALAKFGIDFLKIARSNELAKFIYKLPFVYVYERSDFSTTLYGLQIYPEFIRETLIESPLNVFLTGKFTMITKFDKEQNQFVEINIESRKNKKITRLFEKKVFQKIISGLRRKSSEFRELSDYFKERSFIKPVFWPYEHTFYFKSGIKQKWVKQEDK